MKCGIMHQTTIPGTPEQNAIAERMNRTIKERTKCLLFDASLDDKYWAEAVAKAMFLITRSISASTGKQPESIWSNSSVELSYLRIFESEAFVHIQREKRSKFSPNSRKTLLIGYCEGTKDYPMIDQQSSHITKSKNVKFLEKTEA